MPVTALYALSPLGESLIAPLTALIRWAQKHATEAGFVDEPSARA